jgi:hypothetical protein
LGKKTVEVPGIKQPQSPREINGGWIIAIATTIASVYTSFLRNRPGYVVTTRSAKIQPFGKLLIHQL